MSGPIVNADLREARRAAIFKMPPEPLREAEWLWWFWLFFIHDEKTKETGKCRQVMILWSIKPEKQIICNSLDICIPDSVVGVGPRWTLNGASAAWYFDGERMNDDFVLERSEMRLDEMGRKLEAPGQTPSRFEEKGGEYVTSISTPARVFEFHAKQTDPHPIIGPNYGLTKLPLGMEVEGTRLERLDLKGWETGEDGKRKSITGTAYFQKIRLRAPLPQWYWGLYHFRDGSVATYMQVYAGRAMLADNIWPHQKLRRPKLSAKEDILVYHAPTGRVFEGNRLRVTPRRAEEAGGGAAECWTHQFDGGGKDFEVEGEAQGYAHARWTFRKRIAGRLPFKSTFQYNEYPSVLKRLVLRPKGEEPILLENGWGNMENAWGFMI